MLEDLRHAVFVMLRKAATKQFSEALAPLKSKSVDIWILRLASLLTQMETSSLDKLTGRLPLTFAWV